MPIVAKPAKPTVRVRLVCEGRPADRFEVFDGRRRIQVELQTKDGHEAGSPVGKDARAWSTEVTVKSGPDGAPDFAGPAVHGKRGERFFYLRACLKTPTTPVGQRFQPVPPGLPARKHHLRAGLEAPTPDRLEALSYFSDRL